MRIYAYNPSTWEAKVGGSRFKANLNLQVQGHDFTRHYLKKERREGRIKGKREKGRGRGETKKGKERGLKESNGKKNWVRN